jgi:hypothetical protein
MKYLTPIGACLAAALSGWLVIGAYAEQPAYDAAPARAIVVAQNSCIQMCQARLKQEVYYCNYPQKEIAELTRCLATARSNFDACRQTCR